MKLIIDKTLYIDKAMTPSYRNMIDRTTVARILYISAESLHGFVHRHFTDVGLYSNLMVCFRRLHRIEKSRYNGYNGLQLPVDGMMKRIENFEDIKNKFETKKKILEYVKC